MIAAVMFTLCGLVGCGLPSEPSVARQAMAFATSPLTITAALDALPVDGVQEIQLTVADVDNGDWNSDLRPDSRIHGFHGATLSPTKPSITRSFSIDATRSVVSFTLIGSLTTPPREVFRGRVSYRGTDGWELTLPGMGSEPVGRGADATTLKDPSGRVANGTAAIVISAR